MHGQVLVNPSSGPESTSAADLRDALPGGRVVECDPSELAERAEQAVADGVDFLGVAGGDGSIRTAAEVLRATDVALLPIPAGTRNHFARQLGLDDLAAVARAVDGGAVRAVDIGTMNGRCFVNNASLGLYPKVVSRREEHERHVPKPVANVLAMLEQVRHGRRFGVEVDDRRYRAWMVFIGNGCYGDGAVGFAWRERLDANVLDVRVVRADRRFARWRVLGALLFGRLDRSPLIETMTTRSVRLDFTRRSVDVALDGEVERLDTPLVAESLPGALRVLAPEPADDPA